MTDHILTVQDVILEMGDNWETICIREDDTVSSALEIIKNNKISSLPVQGKKGNFLGIVDILDLITFCTAKFSSVSLLASDSFRQMDEFAKNPIKDIMDISGRNAWIYISYNSSLNELMRLLSKVHRVAVIDEAGDVIGLITQSRMVEFLYKRRNDWTDVMKEKVHKLEKNVETINMKEFVIEAFKRIWDKEVTGLAVVNNDGKLVANISASDLLKTRVFPVGEMIHDLYQPIKNFLNIREDIKDRVMLADKPEYKPISVSAHDNLESSMLKCLENKVHRVFIQDDKGKPIGVISLSDMIRQFLVE